jgi:hypothetical protein
MSKERRNARVRAQGRALVVLVLGGAALWAGTGCSRQVSSEPGTSPPASSRAGLGTAVLDVPGVSFRYPGTWRSTPYPNGLTPGAMLVIDVLTDPSGRTVTWSYDAQHLALAPTTESVAGRAVVPRSGPAGPACSRGGGTREVVVEVSAASGPRNVRELVVDACLGPDGSSPAESELGAMLASLRSTA